MERSHRAVLALAITFVLTACSDRSPVAPDLVVAEGRAATDAIPGSYAIHFLKETRTGLMAAADTEVVGTYLVLQSEIRDYAGNLAETGTVTYEYCSLNGNYAPSSSCTGGSGRWKRWASGPVDPAGLRYGFGSCSTPRTIGFRVKYSSQGGAIANGISAARDFTWAAVPST
jgi:hypothetical protein